MFKRKPEEKPNEKPAPEKINYSDNTLLVVKSKRDAMKGIETFLSKRHWEITPAVDVKHIFQLLTQKKPKFIMIPVDHPNPKMQMLPKLVGQAFQCTVIYYAEFNTPASNLALQKLPQEFCLYPPASGPAVERMMLKVQKSQKSKTDMSSIKAAVGEAADAKDAALINIRGSKIKAMDAKSFEKAKSVLHKAVQTGPGKGLLIYNPQQTPLDKLMQDYSRIPSSQKSGSQVFTGTESDLLEAEDSVEQNEWLARQIADIAAGDQGLTEEEEQIEAEAKAAMAQLQSALPGAAAPRKNLSNLGKKTDFGSVINKQKKAAAEESVAEVKPVKPQGPGLTGGISNGSKSASTIIQSEKETKPQSNIPAIPEALRPAEISIQRSKRNRLPFMLKADFAKSEHADSMIVKGLDQALEKSVTSLGYDSNDEEINQTSNVCCISVSSDSYAGYLVLAYGNNRLLDPNVTTIIRNHLLDFMQLNKESLNFGKNFHLEIEPVPFEPWAVHDAICLRRSVHLGHEIAIAFFPSKNAEVAFGKSPSNEMATMDINEVEAGQVLEFDIFIYSAANARYVRYATKGYVFQTEQKDRLLQKGITKIHVMKTEVKNVDANRVKKFINDKIIAFKKKRPSSAA
ncbi:MAG: hypothetical protein V4736_08865 [Bdellovibrionota bacterium]